MDNMVVWGFGKGNDQGSYYLGLGFRVYGMEKNM